MLHQSFPAFLGEVEVSAGIKLATNEHVSASVDDTDDAVGCFGTELAGVLVCCGDDGNSVDIADVLA